MDTCLNLIGIGPISSQIVIAINKQTESFETTFPISENGGEDLESNEKHFEQLNFQVDEEELNKTEQVFCFVDGKYGISGITLSVLEKFKSKPITIFYIKEDLNSKVEEINHKITFNILQEFARSGAFRAFFAFDYSKIWNNIVYNNESLPEEFEFNHIDNLVIDKLIFCVHLYWRLLNENYAQGNKINFDSTIYKTNIFFEMSIENKRLYNMYYSIKEAIPVQKILISNIPKKMNKKKLEEVIKLKSLAKSEKSSLVCLNDDIDFVIGIVRTNIVLESNYLEEHK